MQRKYNYSTNLNNFDSWKFIMIFMGKQWNFFETTGTFFSQLDSLPLTLCWQWRLGRVSSPVQRRLIDRMRIACWTGQVLRMQIWKAMVIITIQEGLRQHSAVNPKCNVTNHYHHLLVFTPVCCLVTEPYVSSSPSIIISVIFQSPFLGLHHGHLVNIFISHGHQCWFIFNPTVKHAHMFKHCLHSQRIILSVFFCHSALLYVTEINFNILFFSLFILVHNFNALSFSCVMFIDI